MTGTQSGPVGHRDSLREAAVDEAVGRVAGAPNGAHDVADVGDVVGDGQLTILTGHPATDNVPAAIAVVPMERLHGHPHPPLAAGDAVELGQVALGVLAVAVEADQQRRRSRRVSRGDEVAAMGRHSDRMDGGGGGLAGGSRRWRCVADARAHGAVF